MINNFLLADIQSRVTLSNGFQFVSLFDIVASFQTQTELMTTLSVNKRYEILLTKNNKISFKKQTELQKQTQTKL